MLKREFFQKPPESLAKDLLGKIIVRKYAKAKIVAIITETEAYLHENDEAAHAFKGKTKSNNSLYLDAGHLYIHRMRGNNLMDIVANSKGIAGSVLIRSVKIIEGLELALKNRPVKKIEDLSNGPGKLCQALDVSYGFNGLDITKLNSEIYLEESDVEVTKIIQTKRVGINKSKDLMLRFYYDF